MEIDHLGSEGEVVVRGDWLVFASVLRVLEVDNVDLADFRDYQTYESQTVER